MIDHHTICFIMAKFWLRFFITGAALMMIASLAMAQNLTDELGNLATSPDAPINVEADRLDILDDEKKAIFSGNVIVTQDELTLETAQLTIFYTRADNNDPEQVQEPTAMLSAGSQLQRLEAFGNVLVTTPQQSATSSSASFDVASNIITMEGNVVLSQNGNILRGERLIVNLTTKRSQMEAGTARSNNGQPARRQRVQGLFIPNSENIGQ